MDFRTIDREETFWRTQYRSRPYVTYGAREYDYLPAYRYGIDACLQFPDRSFSDLEEAMARNWHKARGTSSLKWPQAKFAARDSWERMVEIVAAMKAAAEKPAAT